MKYEQKVLLIGGVAGALLGVAAAYLYVKNNQDQVAAVNEGRTEMVAKVSPREPGDPPYRRLTRLRSDVPLAESLDDSVRGSKSVAMALGAAPLAAIPYLENDNEVSRRKRRLATRAVAAVGGTEIEISVADPLEALARYHLGGRPSCARMIFWWGVVSMSGEISNSSCSFSPGRRPIMAISISPSVNRQPSRPLSGLTLRVTSATAAGIRTTPGSRKAMTCSRRRAPGGRLPCAARVSVVLSSSSRWMPAISNRSRSMVKAFAFAARMARTM